MRVASLILCLFAVCTAVHAIAPAELHELDTLVAYTGIWKTESKYFKTAFSQAGDGVLTIKGNVWTFPWSSVINGKTIYFHVINVFSGRDHIEYREEYFTDGKHWVPVAKGRDTRLH